MVSFNGPYGGYISRTPIDLNGDSDMIFKFRTSEADGVMVFSSNADKVRDVFLKTTYGINPFHAPFLH